MVSRCSPIESRSASRLAIDASIYPQMFEIHGMPNIVLRMYARNRRGTPDRRERRTIDMRAKARVRFPAMKPRWWNAKLRQLEHSRSPVKSPGKSTATWIPGIYNDLIWNFAWKTLASEGNFCGPKRIEKESREPQTPRFPSRKSEI